MPADDLREAVVALGLEDALPERARPLMELRQYRPGEALAVAGQPIHSFSILVRGRCRVESSSQEGRQAVLGYLAPPAVNGDIELLCSCPSLHGVRAVGPVTVIAIPRAVFLGQMMNHLPFVQMLCRGFAAKLYDTSSKHSSDMLYPVKSRLAHYMLGRMPPKGHTLPLKTGETAQYLGISTRHLRRVLAGMEEEGLVRREDGVVTVLDPEALGKEAALLPG